MNKPFRPLLSATIEDTSKIQYPVSVSCKLDGVRCIVIDGVAMSRSLKPIPNAHVQACIGKPEYNGLDGELIVGDPFAPDCYRATSSGVMSRDGEPDFTFHVFDRIDVPDTTFMARYSTLRDMPFVKVVPHLIVSHEEGLLEVESELLGKGAEGVMVRSLTGVYKNGRSTLKDGILGKLKRFQDAEFKVIGFEERLRNENEATVNALGHTERSTHKENLVGRGDLGALVLEHPAGEFRCGTGFNDADRAEIWANRDSYLGRMAKIKSFAIGVKNLPRFPVWLGFRDMGDMS